MKSILIFVFLLLISTKCFSDPPWESNYLRETDCETLEWADQRTRCYSDLSSQKYERAKFYFFTRLKSIKSDNCSVKQVITHFQNSENKRREYASEYCSWHSHCVGNCGSGHAGVYAACFSELATIKLDLLEKDIAGGHFI